jgi:death on curing protein
VKEPIWVFDPVVLAVHAEQLAEHGGREGIRDSGLLQFALDAPKNVFHYEQADIFKLAAIYGYRLSNNQPFIDGNKRTGYVVSRLFLMLNGHDIQTNEVSRVQMYLDISNNAKSEDELAGWIKQSAVKLVANDRWED